MATYAIVQTGGKQYRVQAGDKIRVESLPVYTGEIVDIDDVLVVSSDGDVTVGTPRVEGARVRAQVTSRGRGRKITVFKYKRKVRYRRKKGHRQPYTDLRVIDISLDGEAVAAVEEEAVVSQETDEGVAGAADQEAVEPEIEDAAGANEDQVADSMDYRADEEDAMDSDDEAPAEEESVESEDDEADDSDDDLTDEDAPDSDLEVEEEEASEPDQEHTDSDDKDVKGEKDGA